LTCSAWLRIVAIQVGAVVWMRDERGMNIMKKAGALFPGGKRRGVRSG